MEQISASDIQKLLYVIQILFYLVTGTVVVMTYQNAKRGLLSPVHTEYQEHVIERLKELSRDLDTEFDPESPNYWAASKNAGVIDEALKTQIDQINNEFSSRREELLTKGDWEPYTHGHSSRYHQTQRLARSIKADPFLPPAIRRSLTEMLNARAVALYEAEEQALNAYRQELVKGLRDPQDSNYHLVLGEDLRAARLWGAAAELRKPIERTWNAAERMLHEPQLIVARSRLDEETWDKVFAEGRTMALEEAVEYALSEEEITTASSQAPDQPLAHEQPPSLTRREQEIAALVAQGLTNRQIASELSISEHTAATHIARSLKKLGLSSRTQLATCVAE